MAPTAAVAVRRRSTREIVGEFLQQCTFGGVSHAVAATTRCLRRFWIVVFVVGMVLLSLQLYQVLAAYLAYPTAVNIQLGFERLAFPAVTFCNLNPFKNSLIKQLGGSVGSATSAFNEAMQQPEQAAPRVKRSLPVDRSQYENLPVLARCACIVSLPAGTRDEGKSCLPIDDSTTGLSFLLEGADRYSPYRQSQCICQFNGVSKRSWPCFPAVNWVSKPCECDSTGVCKRVTNRTIGTGREASVCLCNAEYDGCLENVFGTVPHTDDGMKYYMEMVENQAGSEQTTSTSSTSTTTSTTRAPDVEEALGFEGMTDEVAIVTKGKENLVFAVAALTQPERRRLSYTLDEFMLKCSFNQRGCDMRSDFTQFLDPAYGNCYTFNWNASQQRFATKAGANYGLKVLLYANLTDYMPTTEAAGVRVLVHPQGSIPFPDAFGASAPTGFSTAFGIHQRYIERLSWPYGDCVSGTSTAPTYIYKGADYSTEGCFRSCFQARIIDECGCGDPRFPVLDGDRTCDAENKAARECIESAIAWLTTVDDVSELCSCNEPCRASASQLSMSFARWPSASVKVEECEPKDILCVDRYRKHGALISVFFQRLNYELLYEVASYPFATVLANFGGLMGLWLGLSIISMLEVFVFLYNLIFACYAEHHHHDDPKQPVAFDPKCSLECMCDCDPEESSPKTDTSVEPDDRLFHQHHPPRRSASP